MGLIFKNFWKRSTTKNYRPVTLLSVVSKVFEKPANNRIVDHLEKFGLFSDFQYGFRSSQSTVDLLAVVYDRIAGLLHKLKHYEISGQIFGLIFYFLSNRRLRVVLTRISSECWSSSRLHSWSYTFSTIN